MPKTKSYPQYLSRELARARTMGLVVKSVRKTRGWGMGSFDRYGGTFKRPHGMVKASGRTRQTRLSILRHEIGHAQVFRDIRNSRGFNAFNRRTRKYGEDFTHEVMAWARAIQMGKVSRSALRVGLYSHGSKGAVPKPKIRHAITALLRLQRRTERQRAASRRNLVKARAARRLRRHRRKAA